MPRSGRTGSCIDLFLVFESPPSWFPEWLYQFAFPSSEIRNCFFHNLTRSCCSLLCQSWPFDWGEMKSQSLQITTWKHMFYMLLFSPDVLETQTNGYHLVEKPAAGNSILLLSVRQKLNPNQRHINVLIHEKRNYQTSMWVQTLLGSSHWCFLSDLTSLLNK